MRVRSYRVYSIVSLHQPGKCPAKLPENWWRFSFTTHQLHFLEAFIDPNPPSYLGRYCFGLLLCFQGVRHDRHRLRIMSQNLAGCPSQNQLFLSCQSLLWNHMGYLRYPHLCILTTLMNWWSGTPYISINPMGKPWGFSETHRHTKVQLTKPLPWKPGAEISMTKDQGCWKHLQEKVRSNYDTCCFLLFLLLGFTLPTAPKVDQLSNVQIIQFPSTTNWTKNQPYEEIKNTFFGPCLWRHKIFGTQWSCFFGRFGPFGFGAFLFLRSSLVLQKKQLDYSNEPQPSTF